MKKSIFSRLALTAIAAFSPVMLLAQSVYPINFDSNAKQANAETNKLTQITMNNPDGKDMTVDVPDGTTVYRPLLDAVVNAKPGDTLTPSITFEGFASMKAFLYADLNQDGRFESAVSGGTPSQMPSFTLPADTKEGVYRMRLVIDANNTADPAASAQTVTSGGMVVDFLINVHEQYVKVDARGVGGHIVGYNNGGVPQTTQYGRALRLMTLAPADGYKVESVTVRHGHGLNGEQYINGNRQWQESTVEDVETDENFKVLSAMIDGDIRITAKFKADGTEEYKLKFADEFNGKDGSLPDASTWHNCTRENPTWKRFTSQTPEGQRATAFIRDGKLVTRAIKNTIDEEGDVDMISGAIESSDKMYFTYGRIEGRLCTTPHRGNFPAFWLMPQDNSAGWPNAGEIDIWEQIDTESKTYHTVHTHPTYDLGLARPNSGSKSIVSDEYHVYTLEWEPELLTWYVDGEKVFSYAKSSDPSLLEKGQWPFNKPFYPILNQSVGNGSWAQPCDVDFEYETLFDYVRVYQKDGEGDIVNAVNNVDAKASSLDVYPREGGVQLVTAKAQKVNIYNLSGARVFAESVQGNKFVALAKGVYVVNGEKLLIK